MEARPLRLPELSELAAFTTAVEEGSIAAAARRLRLTGPAIAKRIRNLEALAGRRLLDRTQRGVYPTPAGRAMLGAATQLLSDAEALVDETGGSDLRIAGVHELIGSASPHRTAMLLHETETLFAQLFHTSPDAIVISTLADGRLIEANDAFCRLTALDRHELRGRTSLSLGLWPDPTERAEIVARLRRDAYARGDTTMRSRDGRDVLVAYVANVIRIRDDDILLIRLDDVTERRRLEREAQAHQRRNELLNHLAEMVVTGAPLEAVSERAVELLATELGGAAALVALTDPPAVVKASPRRSRLVSELVAEAAVLRTRESSLGVRDGIAFVAQRMRVVGKPQLAIVAAAPKADGIDADALAMVGAVVSLIGVSIGWRRATETTRALIERAPHAIVVADDGGTILVANACARELLGPACADGTTRLQDVLVVADASSLGWWQTLLDDGELRASAIASADGTTVGLRLQVTGDLVPGRHLVVLGTVAAAPGTRHHPAARAAA